MPLATISRAARSARSAMSSTVRLAPVGVHGLDGAEQVALRVGDAFGQERLVEVGVGLHRGGRTT